MTKKIILFLIAFINNINGMDQQPSILTLISGNSDALWKLTEQLCIITERHHNTTNYFKNLALTNRFFCSYYMDEKNQQRIIEFLNNSPQYPSDMRYNDSFYAARFLQFHKIYKKIGDIHQTANNRELSFTEEDLKEENAWYLNSIKGFPCGDPLWMHIIETKSVEKAKLLIEKSYIKIPTYIFEKIMDRIKKNGYCQDLFDIFEILLQRISPDQRNRSSSDSELMMAARNGQKEIARLLLEKGANPYLLKCYCYSQCYAVNSTYDHINRIPGDKCLYNAFLLEKGEPKGWLMQMYKEIQQSKLMQ